MMASLTIDIATEGREEFFAWIASLCEAVGNAHLDVELDSPADGFGVTHDGATIVSVTAAFVGRAAVITVKPTPQMILFADWLLEQMPRATVEWRGDWPFITCPPNDDRDHEDGPAPLAPRELEPA